MLVSRLSRSPVGGRAVIGLSNVPPSLRGPGTRFAGAGEPPRGPDAGSRPPGSANQTMGLTDSRTVIDMPADLNPAAASRWTSSHDGVYTLDLRLYSMRSENYRRRATPKGT